MTKKNLRQLKAGSEEFKWKTPLGSTPSGPGPTPREPPSAEVCPQCSWIWGACALSPSGWSGAVTPLLGLGNPHENS